MTLASPVHATPSSAGAPMHPVSWQDFLDHVRYSSPFAQDRVSDPAEADVDVPGIHQEQFDELTQLAEFACRSGRGVGVLLWGEAGVGKSHLLARFHGWAEKDDRALYVFLHNVHVNAERLPRYVLKSVVSRLTAGRSTGPISRQPEARPPSNRISASATIPMRRATS